MPSDSTLMEKDSYVSATRPSQLDTIIATAKREANLPAKESSEPMASIPLEEERVTQPPKPNWIVVFFSDRPLAKIGGILLFLGALFFLSLIWSVIGAK